MPLSRCEIEAKIPHRPPFLLLDEIVTVEETRIHARTTLRRDDSLLRHVYAGHYPATPVTPGILLCEMVFQAGAVLMAHRLEKTLPAAERENKIPVLTRIRDARFKRIVRPEETVDILAEFEEQVSQAIYMKGSVEVGGEVAVRVAFTCALVEAGGEEGHGIS